MSTSGKSVVKERLATTLIQLMPRKKTEDANPSVSVAGFEPIVYELFCDLLYLGANKAL